MPKLAIPKQIIFDDETYWLVKSAAVESAPGVTDFSATIRRIVHEWAALRQAKPDFPPRAAQAPSGPGDVGPEAGR